MHGNARKKKLGYDIRRLDRCADDGRELEKLDKKLGRAWVLDCGSPDV